MQTQAAPAYTGSVVNQPDNDPPAIGIALICELSQENHASPFRATLVREETLYWDDDPDPDVTDTIICTTELPPCRWRDVFAAVNQWLHDTYGLYVPQAAWQPGSTGPDAGVIMLLHGHAAAA